MLCGRDRVRAGLMSLAFGLLTATVAVAAPPTGNPFAVEAAKDHAVVDLFAAIEAGEIEASFIPKDAAEANILFKNKTDKPLAIRMPAALGASPVLAQFGGGFGGGGMGGMGGMGMGGMGGGGMGGMGGGMQAMGMGGGMGGGMGMGGMGGGMGMGGMGGGGFGGFMNVDAGKVGKAHVATLCLEHGKADPTPRAKYVLRPLTTINPSPEVAAICAALGRGEIPQNAAQAATWHLTNGLSLQELAAKDRVRLSNGYTEKFFSTQDLNLASQILLAARKAAEAAPPTGPATPSYGETLAAEAAVATAPGEQGLKQ